MTVDPGAMAAKIFWVFHFRLPVDYPSLPPFPPVGYSEDTTRSFPKMPAEQWSENRCGDLGCDAPDLDIRRYHRLPSKNKSAGVSNIEHTESRIRYILYRI